MQSDAVVFERSIVGHMIDHPEEVDDILGVLDPNNIGSDNSRSVVKAMANLRFKGEPVEIPSVCAELGGDTLEIRRKLIEFKMDKPKDTSKYNVNLIIAKINEAASIRQTKDLLLKMNEAISSGDASNYADLEHEFLLRKDISDNGSDTESIGDIAAEQAAQITEVLTAGRGIAGIPTGYLAIDNLIGGLREGLHMVAALSSVGKSTLAMNIGTNIAIREKLPVFAVSYEMSKSELSRRIICSEALVPFTNFDVGNVSEADMVKICEATYDLRNAPLYLSSDGELTLAEIALEARRIKAQNGGKLGAIIVDYIQIAPLPAAETESYAVKAFSRGLKVISSQLHCPVIGISQFTKDSIKNPTGRQRITICLGLLL